MAQTLKQVSQFQAEGVLNINLMGCILYLNTWLGFFCDFDAILYLLFQGSLESVNSTPMPDANLNYNDLLQETMKVLIFI